MANDDSKSKQEKPAASRRSFLKTVMTGTVAAGLSATVGKAEAATLTEACDTTPLAVYNQEKNARDVAYHPAEYFELEATEQELPGFPGGGIWVAVGPPGSEGLEQLRGLLNAQDYEGLGFTLLELQETVTGLVVDQESPFASVSEIPALAEMTYAGKLVAGGLFIVPGSDVMLSFLPYNGGNLNPGAFQLAQYSLQGSSHEPLESLVILRKPVLTTLEQSILSQLPEEISAIQLGDGGLVSHWGVIAAGIVLVVGYVAGAYYAEKAANDVQQQRAEQQRQMEQQYAGTDDKNNGGSLSYWLNEENISLLSNMDVTSAATKLLQVRSNLVQGRMTSTL